MKLLRLSGIALMAAQAAAYDHPLGSSAIREAYFIGSDNRFAEVLTSYTKNLPAPKTGPHVAQIEVRTPFAQVIVSSHEHSVGYSPMQAAEDYKKNPDTLQVRIQIRATATYAIDSIVAAPQVKLMEKEKALTAEIERVLPDFARSCRDSADVVIIHQDSFAADYQDEEYALFGKAMKFAGIYGKEIRVIGRNRETLTTAKAARHLHLRGPDSTIKQAPHCRFRRHPESNPRFRLSYVHGVQARASRIELKCHSHPPASATPPSQKHPAGRAFCLRLESR